MHTSNIHKSVFTTTLPPSEIRCTENNVRSSREENMNELNDVREVGEVRGCGWKNSSREI